MISLLVAYSKNLVIGKDGKIPWKLPSERNRFKEICNGKKVIMGRKTFEEIGHALSYCTIVILSASLDHCPEGCLLASTPQQALEICKNHEILVAGGSEIYRLFISSAKKIYATEIDEEFEGNSFFPEIKKEEWEKAILEEKKEAGISYKYVTYTRI